MVGHVKWFNPSKGYGFIQSGNQDYFVHVSKVSDNFRSQADRKFFLSENSRVEFDIEDGERGPKAVNVR